jgi:photosynthetic reaction center cytochrome c subunit
MTASARTQIAGAIFILLAILTVAVPSIQAQQGGAAGRTAGEANRNIQVLNDLPADQLIPTMRFFSYSLGVECEFCHVEGDNPSDDKQEKKTAREMISMVMAINKDNFDSRTEVTCYTCHQGANEPAPLQPVESTKIIPGGTPPRPPAPAGQGGAPGAAGRGAPPAAAAEPAAPALPSIDDVLAKYVQALGGEQALRKITSRTISGTRDNAGRNEQDSPWTRATFELYEKAPNLQVMTVHAANGQTTATGFDGTSAWTQNANGVVAEANGTALARAQRAANFYEPLELKQEFTRMAVRGIAKVDGRDAYVVAAVPSGDSVERLYFDTQTGLLVRRVMALQNVVANAPTQTDYLDYRTAGGVKYPSTIKISDVVGNPMYTVFRLTKVDVSAPVDASKFTKPVSRPQAGRGGGGRGGGGAGRGGAQ